MFADLDNQKPEIEPPAIKVEPTIITKKSKENVPKRKYKQKQIKDKLFR